jgi:PAS domain S-box-containing protein
MSDTHKGLLDRPYARYAMAVVVVAASFLLRHFLVQGLGLAMPPFITFFPAIIIVAVLAGLGPGLLATALAALAADYYILPPFGFPIESISDDVALVLFATMGILISLLAEGYRRSLLTIAAYKEKQALWVSNEKLDVALAAMTDAVFISDAKGQFIQFNDAFASFHKFANKSTCARTLAEYPEFLEVSMADGQLAPLEMWAVSRALRGETAANEEYRLRRKDTGEAWIGSYSFGPVRDHEGVIIGSVVVGRDITEQKRAEAHIQRLNRVYSVLSDINQMIVREKDSQTTLEAACRIATEKGKFRMAWVGMADPAAHMIRPIASSGEIGDYLDRVQLDYLDPARSAGPSVQCFLSGEHTVCNDIVQDSRYAPWRDAALRMGYRSHASFPLKVDAQVIGIFNLYSSDLAFFDEDEIKLLDELAMDIGFALEVNRREEDRRKAEEELRWRTAFFEAQVDSAQDGVLVVDGKGKKLLQNQRLNDLLKLPLDVFENPDFAERIQFLTGWVKNPEQFFEKVQFLISHPEEMSQDVVELLDGTILERFSSPVIDKAKIHYGRIWTFCDITERRQMEEQFRQSQKMEAVGQLTGGIAHDFNNLLTVILGCSEIMGDELSENPRLLKMANAILNAAQRGADLTHRMLAFARRQALQPRSVDVNQLVLNLEGLLRHTLSAAIELQVNQRTDLWGAMADPAELESALLNLCINAQDAMPDGGKLTIEADNAFLDSDYANQNSEVQPGQYILISVSDTGTGIDPNILGHVFDPFFTTKEVGKGTGLGLSMVYGFAKQSHGHIKIYSELGHGTSVKLYLPRADQEDESPSQHPTSTADLRGSEVILLVEDDDSVRDYARSQLTDLGYRVLEAATGKEALKIVQEHNDIDLLFTDMVMSGGMNGRELAQEVCRLRPELRVLYSSGYAANAITHQGLLDKDMYLLSKPYSRLALARTIRQVLERVS